MVWGEQITFGEMESGFGNPFEDRMNFYLNLFQLNSALLYLTYTTFQNLNSVRKMGCELRER